MRQQKQAPQGRFTIEKFSVKGPFYMQTHQKVASLHNKITFYEGQLDPLHCENSVIKQNHMNLARIVSISTEILRNLIPVDNTPAKKLKLQMASIDQIAKIIETDWKDMQQTIVNLTNDKKETQEQIEDWKNKLKNEQQRRVREVDQLQSCMQQLKNQHQLRMQNLENQLDKTKAELQRVRMQALQQQALRDRIIDKVNRELELFKNESSCKYNDYQRCIARLKAQMENNLVQFEEGKNMVKQLYQKLMNQKLNEQAEAYEMMLKAKDDEKFKLQLAMSEMIQAHDAKIQEKNDEIQRLTNQDQSKRLQIKRLQDQLYNKKEQLMREIKDNKEMQAQLLRINQKNQALLDRVKKQEITIQQQIEKIKATIQKYEEKIKLVRDQGSQSMSKIISQKNKLQQQMQEKDKEMQAIKVTLETVQQKFRQNLQGAQKKWLQKQSQYTAQIIKNTKKIQEQKQRVRLQIEDRDRQLQNIDKQHQHLLKRLQKQFQQSKQAYIQEQIIKMRKLMEENQQEITIMKLNLKKEYEFEMSKMQEQMRQKSLQLELSIAQNDKKYQEQRKKYEHQIYLIKAKEQLLMQKLTKAKQQTLQRQNQMQKLKIEQLKALKELQLDTDMNNKKWEQVIQQQMQSFLKELEIKETAISSMLQQLNQQRSQFEKKLSIKDAELVSIQQNMQKKINSLKDNNGMMDMEKKHKSQLVSLQRILKAQLYQTEEYYKNQINDMTQKHEKAISQLIEIYDEKNIQNQNSFQKALVNLASQFQQKSTFYSDRQIPQETQQKLNNLSQQEKIQFIRSKLQQNFRLLIDKDNEIASLHQRIQIFQKKIEQYMAIRRKELQAQKQQIINICNDKISKKQQQCKMRIAAIQNQRKVFSQELFQQFKMMRQTHKDKYSTLEKRYKELQLLFSQRPSREEDVTKIKQLISIQTKLDQQIITYHKKMDTANQIVKYLNLQLQNYKETYDIFGPQDHNNFNNHNETISFIYDSHKIIDLYKQQQLQKSKEERQIIHMDRRTSDSPDINQLKVFTEKQQERSQSLGLEPRQVKDISRKYSLVPQKLQPHRERFKTQKIIDRQIELMGHAETFMKFIKKNTRDVSVIRGSQTIEDPKKKTYRMRKLKRLATGVVQHYF